MPRKRFRKKENKKCRLCPGKLEIDEGHGLCSSCVARLTCRLCGEIDETKRRNQPCCECRQRGLSYSKVFPEHRGRRPPVLRRELYQALYSYRAEHDLPLFEVTADEIRLLEECLRLEKAAARRKDS